MWAYKNAADNFQRINRTDFEAGARHRLGILYIHKGLLFDAMQQFERITKIRPDVIDPHIELGAVYFLLGLNNKAISTLTASPLTPDLWDTFTSIGTKVPQIKKIRTYIVLAQAYLRRKDYVKALQYFKKAQALGVEFKPGLLDYLDEVIAAPWKDIEKRYKVGERISGTVLDVTGHGTSIQLEEGIEGLIEPKDFSWSNRFIYSPEAVGKGQKVEAVILGIDKEKKEIVLGVKQLTKDPWENIEEHYKVGDRVKGTVIDVTNYSAFIKMEDDVEGIINSEDLSWTRKSMYPPDVLREK